MTGKFGVLLVAALVWAIATTSLFTGRVRSGRWRHRTYTVGDHPVIFWGAVYWQYVMCAGFVYMTFVLEGRAPLPIVR